MKNVMSVTAVAILLTAPGYAAQAPAAPDPALAGGDLPHAVQRLTAEGLSDRAIARRLRIGLEAVRLLARRQPEPAS